MKTNKSTHCLRNDFISIHYSKVLFKNLDAPRKNLSMEVSDPKIRALIAKVGKKLDPNNPDHKKLLGQLRKLDAQLVKKSDAERAKILYNYFARVFTKLIDVVGFYIAAKKVEKVFTSWKYASARKAKMFKKAYLGYNATDEEIETCAYYLSSSREDKQYNTHLRSWKDPRFLKALKARIQLYRKNPVWEYVNPKKAAFFHKKFPGLKATPEELEAAVSSVCRGDLWGKWKLSHWKDESLLRAFAAYIRWERTRRSSRRSR